jgi:hypothetical protein
VGAGWQLWLVLGRTERRVKVCDVGDLKGRIGTLNFAELVDTPACTATLPTGTDYIHRMMVATLGMA